MELSKEELEAMMRADEFSSKMLQVIEGAPVSVAILRVTVIKLVSAIGMSIEEAASKRSHNGTLTKDHFYDTLIEAIEILKGHELKGEGDYVER